MIFYRVMPWVEADGAPTADSLSPLRRLQGKSRHDNPDLYTAFYCSPSAHSCVSELIQNFSPLSDHDLFRARKRLHLFRFSISDSLRIVDADDPNRLIELASRPSRFATRNRGITQPIARSIYDKGNDGFLWWSTIESSWINATLFAERVAATIFINAAPIPLTITSEFVLNALKRE